MKLKVKVKYELTPYSAYSPRYSILRVEGVYLGLIDHVKFPEGSPELHAEIAYRVRGRLGATR